MREPESPSLRRVFGSFVTGVTVVTTIDAEHRPRGMTANSFTSVSMDPPLVLVCIGQSAASHDEFCAAGSFAVNILTADQQSLSELFASKSAHKFAYTPWRRERSGSPVLEGALAWIDCAVHEKVVAGDHMILVGRVLDLDRDHGMPLGFFGGSYVTFGLDRDAESFVQHHSVIGGIIEVDGRILLCRDTAGGGWTVPAERYLGGVSGGRAALVKKCLALGISAEPTFVYSIFTGDDGALAIIYRCAVDEPARMSTTPTARFFDATELPQIEIREKAVRAMLTRYARERTADRFGIYVESDHGGRVGVLDGEPTAFQHYRPTAKLR